MTRTGFVRVGKQPAPVVVDPGPDPEPDTGVNPWPSGGSITATERTGLQAIINNAQSGDALNPTTVVIPPGVYRESVQVPTKQYITFKGGIGGVDVRGTDVWTAWTKFSGSGTAVPDGPNLWRSHLSVPTLIQEDRWQFEEITPLTVALGAASNERRINVGNLRINKPDELFVGRMVMVGTDSDHCTPTYELRQITGRGTNTIGPYIDLDRGLQNEHIITTRCASHVCHAEAVFVESVYRDGMPEKGGTELRRVVGGDPGPDSFALDVNRKVIVGQNPANHVMEVLVRNKCLTYASTAHDIYFENISFLYTANVACELGGSGQRRPRLIRCEVAHAHTKGFTGGKTTAPLLRQSRLHHCGQMGGAAAGASPLELDRSRFDHNNYKYFRAGWEAGGFKSSGAPSIKVTACLFDHNNGNGMWMDLGPRPQSGTMDDVVAHHNAQKGIRLEDTQGVVISRAICYENGWGVNHDEMNNPNIDVAGSNKCTVQDSILAWGGTNSVRWTTQARQGRDYMYGCRFLRNIVIQEEFNGRRAIEWNDQEGADAYRDSTEYDPWHATSDNRNGGNAYAHTNASGILIPEGSGSGSRYKWLTHTRQISQWNSSARFTTADGPDRLITQQTELTDKLTAAGINLVPEPH